MSLCKEDDDDMEMTERVNDIYLYNFLVSSDTYSAAQIGSRTLTLTSFNLFMIILSRNMLAVAVATSKGQNLVMMVPRSLQMRPELEKNKAWKPRAEEQAQTLRLAN